MCVAGAPEGRECVFVWVCVGRELSNSLTWKERVNSRSQMLFYTFKILLAEVTQVRELIVRSGLLWTLS